MRLTVGFSTTNLFVSKAIRWFLGAQVSHTYVRFYDPFLETEMVFHADWPGVIIEDYEQFLSQNTVIEEYDIEDDKVKEIIRCNLKMLRRKYDGWNIANWAWAIIFKRWVKKKFEEPLENPKKLICVQFVLRFIRKIVPVPKEDLNPKSCREWMSSVHEQYGWKKRTLVA